MKKLIGPFKQIITLSGLPLKGALIDDNLEIIANGGIIIENGLIITTGDFDVLHKSATFDSREEIEEDMVLLPGFVDCHTHICFAGNRAKDYALRIQGKTYLEIANTGGGIWDSVKETREASESELIDLIIQRANRHLSEGVTTIEVKSGYGLSFDEELKQLIAIKAASNKTYAELISTCLAAHLLPKDFQDSPDAYLKSIVDDLLPAVKVERLSNRIDIFIEQSAFNTKQATAYLQKAKAMGFDLTVHADQFTTGGSAVAIQIGALSADHLEASTKTEIKLLSAANIVAVTLPGASLGLGMKYAPARKLLNAGACLAIASDWNPGSAPMGDLLMQAAVMSAAEKLNAAEVFAGLTFRAAYALKQTDRGKIEKGKIADLQAYCCADYREILYHQGKLKPSIVWKGGKTLINKKRTTIL
jgi:imidazolonepropionase